MKGVQAPWYEQHGHTKSLPASGKDHGLEVVEFADLVENFGMHYTAVRSPPNDGFAMVSGTTVNVTPPFVVALWMQSSRH